MADLNKNNKRVNITNQIIQNAKVSGDINSYFIYDKKVIGLHARIAKKAKTFYLSYRNLEKRSRILKLGRFPKLNIENARYIAKSILENIVFGIDEHDIRKEKLKRIAEEKRRSIKLIDKIYEYIEVCSKPHKKKSTVNGELTVINKYIKNSIGNMSLQDVDTMHLQRLHCELGQTSGRIQANRTLALLSSFLNWCELMEYRDLNSNPCRFIKKYKEQKRSRVLTREESKRIIHAIYDLEEKYSNAGAYNYAKFGETVFKCLKFIAYTGCRSSEAKNLTWSEVDLDNGFLRLKDSKTGEKVIPIGNRAVEILSELKKIKKGNFVFYKGRNPKEPVKELRGGWKKVLKQAEVEDFRIQDLRRNFAIVASLKGLAVEDISKALGYSDISIVQRYVKANDVNARKIGNAIEDYWWELRKKNG